MSQPVENETNHGADAPNVEPTDAKLDKIRRNVIFVRYFLESPIVPAPTSYPAPPPGISIIKPGTRIDEKEIMETIVKENPTSTATDEVKVPY